jgi:hypothetical protein
MSFHAINYVELFAANVSVWEDEDLSAHIPADTTAVLLHFESTNWLKTMGAREKGSGDDFTQAMLSANQQRYQVVAVDANRFIQIWKEDNTAGRIKIYLAGYFTDDVHVFKNLIDVTPASATGKIGTASSLTIETVIKKYGDGSARFRHIGTGWDTFIQFDDSDDWDFGAGDFTIGGWFYVDVLPAVGTYYILCSQCVNANNRYFFAIYNNVGVYELRFFAISGGVVLASTTATIAIVANNWYHMEAARNGAGFFFALDGISLVVGGVLPGASILPNLATVFRIGQQNLVGSQYWFNGYMDDLEIAKGICRHIGDFIPPAGPINPDSYTVLYLPLDKRYNSPGSYSDIDITPYVVGADPALGAILYAYRPDGLGVACLYIRKKGSSDNRYDLFASPIGWFVGVDTNKKFQISLTSVTKIKVYLSGYFKRNVQFNTNAIDVSIAGVAEQSINVGSGKVGAIIECSDPANLHTFKLRKPAAPTSVYQQFYLQTGTITGCDSSSNVLGTINNDQLDFYLMGTLTSGYRRLVNWPRATTRIGR